MIMVHERDDKYESQDDGEYHFSDDQANYDVEPEVVKSSVTPVGGGFVAKGWSQYRRQLIGAGVVVFLIFLLYKILAPSAPQVPSSDFASTGTTTTTTTQKVVTKPETAAQEQALQALPAPIGMSSAGPSAPPVVVAPAQQVQPETNSSQADALMASQSGATQAQTSTTTTYVQPAPIVSNDPNTRLAILEEQSAKLQVEITQKMTDMDSQNNALQGKLQDINLRMTSIEATLAQLGRVMQDLRGKKPGMAAAEATDAPTSVVPTPARVVTGPRGNYSVQAIIPGRAWLKSEAGETVTVAEGDILKNYGRIMKIDPYDGVVQIDTGGKIISLSYGVSGE